MPTFAAIERLLDIAPYVFAILLGGLVGDVVSRIHFGRAAGRKQTDAQLGIAAGIGFVVAVCGFFWFAPTVIVCALGVVVPLTAPKISRRSWIAIAIVGAGVWAAYVGTWPVSDRASAITNGFAYDDKDLLTGNDFLIEWMGNAPVSDDRSNTYRSHIAEALTSDFAKLAQKAAGAPGLSPINYFRPVIAMSYLADTWFWSEVPDWPAFRASGKKRLDLKWSVLNPVGFHLTNVLVHALNALLVFVLIRAMTRCYWPAVATALLFAVHPIHTESVTWIAGRTDLIGTTFMLLAFWAYLRFRASGRIAPFVVSCACYVAGVFSKEMVAALPIVIILYETVRWLSTRIGKSPGLWEPSTDPHPIGVRFSAWIAYPLLTIPYFIAKAANAPSIPQPPQANTWFDPLRGELFPMSERFFGFMGAIYWYAWKAFFPTNLDIYPWVDFAESFGDGALRLGGHLVILALAVFAILRWRGGRVLGFAIVAFYASLAPLSSVPEKALLLRFAEDVDFPVSERFVYVPSLFACLAIAWLLTAVLPALFDRRRDPAAATGTTDATDTTGAAASARGSAHTGLLVGGLIVCGLAGFWVFKTQERHPDWKNDFALFASGVRTSPGSVRMANNYGFELMQRWRIKEARRMLRRCTELVSSKEGRTPMPVAFQNLGHSYYLQGEFDQAMQYYVRAQSYEPNNAISSNNLGALMGIFGSVTMNIAYIERGIQCYQRAVEAAPNYVFAKQSLHFMRQVYNTWQLYLVKKDRSPKIVFAFGMSFLISARSISKGDDPKYLQAMMILDAGLRHLPTDAEMLEIMGKDGQKLAVPILDPEIKARGVQNFNALLRDLFEDCYTKALAKYEALLEEHGERNPALNFMMGEVFRVHWRSSRDPEERARAIRHYRITREQEPEHTGAARGLAELLRTIDRTDEAITIVDATVDELLVPRLPWDGPPPAKPEAEPRSAIELGKEVFNRVNELRTSGGGIDDAEFAKWTALRDRTFSKVLDFQRRTAESAEGGTDGTEWNKLGYFHVVAFESLGDRSLLEKSLPLFDKALELAPTRSDSAVNKLTVLKKLGRHAEAEQFRAQMQVRFPRHPAFYPLRKATAPMNPEVPMVDPFQRMGPRPFRSGR